jgi:hypothetical protein
VDLPRCETGYAKPQVTDAALGAIAAGCPSLRHLDVNERHRLPIMGVTSS